MASTSVRLGGKSHMKQACGFLRQRLRRRTPGVKTRDQQRLHPQQSHRLSVFQHFNTDGVVRGASRRAVGKVDGFKTRQGRGGLVRARISHQEQLGHTSPDLVFGKHRIRLQAKPERISVAQKVRWFNEIIV